LKPKKVYFLSEHEVTVEDDGGFRIYKVEPTYRFETQRDCELFISKVRERDLVGTFMPAEVLAVGPGGDMRILSREKVLRFWKREGGPREGNTRASWGSAVQITMTMHLRPDKDNERGKQTERDLGNYFSTATYFKREKRVDLVGKEEGIDTVRVFFDKSSGTLLRAMHSSASEC
jgi:hypothetical protein